MAESGDQSSRERGAAFFEDKRVLVCVGSGGVGKTTTAAALALDAAVRGKRTLCLTIDPARRLAQSLGLDSFCADEVTVSSTWMAERGVTLRAPLTVMMLDAGKTFDELIDRHAASPASAELIKRNRIYRHLSRSVAGTRSYMAMEKVQAVEAEDRFDLIVLDTPPSERVLDFFDAPDKMREILDSPATRALSRMAQAGGAFGVVGQGLKGLFRTMGKVTGAPLIEELSVLLSLLRELFGGFAERAERVAAKLRGAEFGYVLVTAPLSLSLRQADELAAALAQRGIRLEGLVVNRMTEDPGPLLERESFLARAGERASALSGSELAQIYRAAEREAELAAADRRSVGELTQKLEKSRSPFRFRAFVPDLVGEIHEPSRLLELARHLRPERA